MAGAETQPLLSPQDRRGEATDSSSQQPGSSHLSPEQEAKDNVELSARRVVKYTIWFLMSAILLGTVLGTVLVSVPLQRSVHAPEPRKSAAMIVLRSTKREEDRHASPEWLGRSALQSHQAGNDSDGDPTPRVILWSGKVHHSEAVFNDLYTFNVAADRWRAIYRLSMEDGSKQHYPAPRWKAISVYEPKTNTMLVHGGDPLGSDGLGKGYLDDLWRLDLSADLSLPRWSRLSIAEGSAPQARRASAGAVMEVNGTSTLVLWSGRNRQQVMLDDVWAASLESDPLEWRCLFDGSEFDLSEGGESEGEAMQVEAEGGMPEDADGSGESADDLERRKKKKKHKKKKKRKEAPLPRKGHVAVGAGDEERPLLVVWGGRDEAQYFNDLWAFDVTSGVWEEWGLDSPLKPSARNHLGGFLDNGLLYIYGGAGRKEPVEDEENLMSKGDMWAFNISAQTWSPVIPTGAVPPPRYLYSMDTYTTQVNGTLDTRLVVFGGASQHHCYLDDVWEYSVAGNSWRELSKLAADQPKKCKKLEGDH